MPHLSVRAYTHTPLALHMLVVSRAEYAATSPYLMPSRESHAKATDKWTRAEVREFEDIFTVWGKDFNEFHTAVCDMSLCIGFNSERVAFELCFHVLRPKVRRRDLNRQARAFQGGRGGGGGLGLGFK